MSLLLRGLPETASMSRAFAADLSIRSDGRTVHGIVVPFGKVARVSDGGPTYDEGFERGAFSKTLRQRGPARVKLLMHHDRTEPIGVARELEEQDSGLYGAFRVSETERGDEALTLLRDGVLDSFSVGFAPVQHVKRGRVTWRTEVGLREASLVTFPAYEDALVGGVRSLDDFDDDEIRELAARFDKLRSTTPDGVLDQGTSPEVAPSDDGPPTEALRSDLTPAQRVAIAMAALRTRGIAS